jgi:hypothetical protein
VVDGRIAEMWGEADMSQLFATEDDTTAVPELA